MNVYLRYAAATTYLPNPFFTRAYDARMLYVLDGEGEMRFPDKTIPIKRGSLCYYQPGQKYWPYSTKDKPLYFVTIGFDFTRDYVKFANVLPTPAAEDYQEKLRLPSHLSQPYEMFRHYFVLQDLNGMREDFLAVANISTSNRVHRRDAASARLASILYTLIDISDTKQAEVITHAVDYIDKHYGEITSNEEIAAALHYHPNHLNRLFKQHIGTTLHRYLIDVRIKKAADLLMRTELSILEISDMVGFENPNHFSYVFTKSYGTPPTKFRRSSSFI